MKTRPEDDLLHDVFPNLRELRASSLEQTLGSLRRQRRRKNLVCASGVAAICLTLSLLVWNSRLDSRTAPTHATAAGTIQSAKTPFATVPGTSIRILNDEELLSMFANRPVALLGPPEERQFVVLDEIRVEQSARLLN